MVLVIAVFLCDAPPYMCCRRCARPAGVHMAPGDCRCGTIGAKLVERLGSVVAERGLQDSVGVFRCSHIGGHKVVY